MTIKQATFILFLIFILSISAYSLSRKTLTAEEIAEVATGYGEYPQAGDFNERFERFGRLIKQLTGQELRGSLYRFIDGEIYVQKEVNENFDILLDALETHIQERVK